MFVADRIRLSGSDDLIYQDTGTLNGWWVTSGTPNYVQSELITTPPDPDDYAIVMAAVDNNAMAWRSMLWGGQYLPDDYSVRVCVSAQRGSTSNWPDEQFIFSIVNTKSYCLSFAMGDNEIRVYNGTSWVLIYTTPNNWDELKFINFDIRGLKATFKIWIWGEAATVTNIDLYTETTSNAMAITSGFYGLPLVSCYTQISEILVTRASTMGG